MEKHGKNYRIRVIPATPAKVQIVEPARPKEIEITIGERSWRFTPSEALLLGEQLEKVIKMVEMARKWKRGQRATRSRTRRHTATRS